jgi:hypothetical protein
MSDDPETVIVLETPDPMELAMGKQLLEQAGIPCATRDAGSSAPMSALMGQAFGGVRLLEVPAEHADKALEILEGAWGEQEAPDDAEPGPDSGD